MHISISRKYSYILYHECACDDAQKTANNNSFREISAKGPGRVPSGKAAGGIS